MCWWWERGERDCGPRLKRWGKALPWAWSANPCWAKRIQLWPRAESRQRWPTWIRRGAGNDPDAARSRRAHGVRCVHGVHNCAAAHGWRAMRWGAGLLAGDGAICTVQGEIDSDGHGGNWEGLANHFEFVGIHRRRNGAGL